LTLEAGKVPVKGVNNGKAKYHKSQRVFVKPVGTWA